MSAFNATNPHFTPLNDAQLHAELSKCSTCREKPCRTACPTNCDPSEFILQAKTVGAASDFQLAAAHIMSMNSMGGTCGVVCPDKFCMGACTRKDIDGPVNIPAVQATLVHRAKKMGVFPKYPKPVVTKTAKVAVIGAGPAGLACSAVLVRKGYKVTIYDKRPFAGGHVNTIPVERLPREVIETDVDFVKSLGGIEWKLGIAVHEPAQLLEEGYAAVCIAAGLEEGKSFGIEGEKARIDALKYLWNPELFDVGRKVAVIGGGAVAIDAATTAKTRGGAEEVVIFYRRGMSEMPLTDKERQAMFMAGINVAARSQPTKICVDDKGKVCGLEVSRVEMPHRSTGKTSAQVVKDSAQLWNDISAVIYAIGNKPVFDKATLKPGMFLAGDIASGASTVVQASAYGKNVAKQIDEFLSKKPESVPKVWQKSYQQIEGYPFTPVDLSTEYFGYKLINPFLLSAAPPTDGYEQCVLGYKAGWAGVIMKTAFDNVPIHIPNHYMEKFDPNTYGNSDNVSGHSLDRVCGEISKLVKEWPDRLTCGSTGGPVTGDDAADAAGWQSNTKKLEAAGAMCVEYSLSCPQGSDDGEDGMGTIVSQNPPLAAKIIDWVMQVSDPKIPKIFKLTGAVTSIRTVCNAIKRVFDKYPQKKAGITLANSFPGMTFRDVGKEGWEKGIVMGLSGEGVTPISNLTLASAAPVGLTISGNGGPFDYKAAANFLALGAQTVQFCTLPTKMGVEIITELNQAMSHMMAARGIKSVKDLIGAALPEPIEDFMDLTPVKQISSVDIESCIHCGNCTRCPYLAISLNDNKIPEIDAAKCISCGVCTQFCPGEALALRDRTAEEAKLTPE